MEKSKNIAEKVKAILNKVMFVAAGGVLVFYIAGVLLFIVGLGFHAKLHVLAGFAILSGLVVWLSSTFITGQGAKDAAKVEYHKEVMLKYRKLLNKNTVKKKHLTTSPNFLFKRVLTGFITKAISVVIMVSGVIYIALEGSGMWGLLLPTIGNVCMAVALGLKGYMDAYDHYVDEHIPAVLELIERLEVELSEKNVNIHRTSEPVNLRDGGDE